MLSINLLLDLASLFNARILKKYNQKLFKLLSIILEINEALRCIYILLQWNYYCLLWE